MKAELKAKITALFFPSDPTHPGSTASPYVLANPGHTRSLVDQIERLVDEDEPKPEAEPAAPPA